MCTLKDITDILHVFMKNNSFINNVTVFCGQKIIELQFEVFENEYIIEMLSNPNIISNFIEEFKLLLPFSVLLYKINYSNIKSKNQEIKIAKK